MVAKGPEFGMTWKLGLTMEFSLPLRPVYVYVANNGKTGIGQKTCLTVEREERCCNSCVKLDDTHMMTGSLQIVRKNTHVVVLGALSNAGDFRQRYVA